MEREKRLELLRSLLHDCLGKAAYEKLVASNVAGAALAQIPTFPTAKLHEWAAELDEIVDAWPALNDGVQRGMVAMVRSLGNRSISP